jgi:hypothetical protein
MNRIVTLFLILNYILFLGLDSGRLVVGEPVVLIPLAGWNGGTIASPLCWGWGGIGWSIPLRWTPVPVLRRRELCQSVHGEVVGWTGGEHVVRGGCVIRWVHRIKPRDSRWAGCVPAPRVVNSSSSVMTSLVRVRVVVVVVGVTPVTCRVRMMVVRRWVVLLLMMRGCGRHVAMVVVNIRRWAGQEEVRIRIPVGSNAQVGASSLEGVRTWAREKPSRTVYPILSGVHLRFHLHNRQTNYVKYLPFKCNSQIYTDRARKESFKLSGQTYNGICFTTK